MREEILSMAYDEISIIKQAIDHEYEGYEYYLAQSKKINSDEVSDVFKNLAEEELLHVKWLGELLKSKQEGLSISMLKFFEGISPPDIFDWREIKNFRFEDLKEAFRHIMELEIEAVKFYDEASKNATDAPTKVLFEKLSEWEKTHYQMFKNKYDEM